ncbi:MAG: hypothetical protein WEA61_03350 [Anaerolineales bacterium]
MDRQWIKASEIGEYLYCQRAWWYRLQDAANANMAELSLGALAHVRHGRGLRLASWQRLVAMVLIMVAMGLLMLEVLK